MFSEHSGELRVSTSEPPADIPGGDDRRPPGNPNRADGENGEMRADNSDRADGGDTV